MRAHSRSLALLGSRSDQGPIGKIGHRNRTRGQHCRKRSRHAMIEAEASPGRESSVKSSHFRPYLGIQMFCGPGVVAAADACREAAVPTIALVDDDHNILTSLSIALEAQGYQINTYIDGFAALAGFRTEPPDLAIFDVKMPRMDGMETLRRLRQKSDLPVIFLASRDDEMDELISLKMGADDYIRKPFSPRLLLERVKVLLRRALPRDGAAAREAGSKILERGELRMDPERHCCTWKNEPVMLTRTEFLILQALASRPGVVKSRRALTGAAYDNEVYADERTIDSHVKRLRRKFKARDLEFDMIESVYGIGYRFKEVNACR